MIPIISADRNCNGCTICCDGWATGVAHGHKFFPGRKCHYVSESGCTIYEDRPAQPCKNFKCVWLTDHSIPEWLKPNLSGALLATETLNGTKFITVKETGKQLNVNVLSWLIHAYQTGIITNMRYELDGGWNFVGTPEFLKMMSGNKQDKQL